MRNVEIKKIISYVVLALFLITLSYFLLRFYIHQNNIIFIPTFILSFTLFIISIFDLEFSFLIFLFFMPLLNSLHLILSNLHFPVLYFLFLGLFLGGLINLIKRNKSLIYFKQKIYNPFLIFIILASISFVFTVSRLINFYPFIESEIQSFTINTAGWNNFIALNYAFFYFLNYLSGFLLFLILGNIEITEKFINRFFYSISISFLIVFFVGLYQIFFNKSFGNFGFFAVNNRINSTLTDPNSLGMYLFILFPIFIGFGYYFYNFKKYLSIFSFILSILTLIMIMYSGSRSGFLGIVIIILFYFIYLGVILFKKTFRKFNINKIFLNLISYFIIILLSVLFFYGFIFIVKNVDLDSEYPSLLVRIKQNIDIIGEENFLSYFSSGRNILWVQAAHMFMDYPISGVGVGQFIVEVSNYNTIKYGNIGLIDCTNNYYFQILSEMGILSLIVILWFFIGVIFYAIFAYIKIEDNKFKFLYLNLLLCFVVMLIIFNTSPNIIFYEIQYIFILVIWLLIKLRECFVKNINVYNENSEK